MDTPAALPQKIGAGPAAPGRPVSFRDELEKIKALPAAFIRHRR
ncbi:hypothetical protein [Arenibaculum sp.]|nr:hypothetical protein [Arenibaculum sp.]